MPLVQVVGNDQAVAVVANANHLCGDIIIYQHG
jgi:hypothetical protein